jgi:membrane protein
LGCGLAALFWIIGSVTFTYYVKHFGSYNRTYGDLGPTVGFLTWVWFSVVVLLMGAEIDRALDRRDGGAAPVSATGARGCANTAGSQAES